jgi:hypothetical protein
MCRNQTCGDAEHSNVLVWRVDFLRRNVGRALEGGKADGLTLKLPALPGIFPVWQGLRLRRLKNG